MRKREGKKDAKKSRKDVAKVISWQLKEVEVVCFLRLTSYGLNQVAGESGAI